MAMLEGGLRRGVLTPESRMKNTGARHRLTEELDSQLTLPSGEKSQQSDAQIRVEIAARSGGDQVLPTALQSVAAGRGKSIRRAAPRAALADEHQATFQQPAQHRNRCPGREPGSLLQPVWRRNPIIDQSEDKQLEIAAPASIRCLRHVGNIREGWTSLWNEAGRHVGCSARPMVAWLLSTYSRRSLPGLLMRHSGRSALETNLVSRGTWRSGRRTKSAASAGVSGSPSQMHARAATNSSRVDDQQSRSCIAHVAPSR